MRCTKPVGSYLAGLLRLAWGLERALLAVGRVAVPTALLAAIASGEWLAHGANAQGLVGYGTVRALHVLAGAILAFALGYRVATAAARGWRALGGWNGPPPWREAARMAGRLSGSALVEAAYWVVLAMLVLSGMDRLLIDLFGWGTLPSLAPGVWMVIHGITPPYLYASITLLLYLRLRRALPALLDYVHRHY